MGELSEKILAYVHIMFCIDAATSLAVYVVPVSIN